MNDEKIELLEKILEVLYEKELPDSLEFGPANARVKVYCDFLDKETAKRKIDNAIELRDYAHGITVEKMNK